MLHLRQCLSITAHAPGKLCSNCGGPSLCQTLRLEGWLLRDEQWEAGWWPSPVTAAASRPAPEHRAESPHHGETGPRLFICDKCSQLCSQIALYGFLFIFFPVKFLAWLMEDGEEMHPSKTASLGFAGALFQSACWPWADYELWLFYFF